MTAIWTLIVENFMAIMAGVGAGKVIDAVGHGDTIAAPTSPKASTLTIILYIAAGIAALIGIKWLLKTLKVKLFK